MQVERLHESGHISKSDVVRINAYQRSQDIPQSIIPYCTSDTDDLSLVSRYRVVVCTCSMAGLMYSFGPNIGHFTHVFVDEVGDVCYFELILILYNTCELLMDLLQD